MTEPSIMVAGEALVDLVGEADGRYRAVPGGSPANVAVGLSRLGAPTHLLARLGTGAFGRLIRTHLTGNGVRLDHAVDAAEPATLAVVSLDELGGASYDFYADGTADWEWRTEELPAELPAGTLALCTGSIALARRPGAAALVDLVRREHERGEVTVVLDPNLRPALLGSPEEVARHWDELVASADVIKVSDEDLRRLAPDRDPASLAASWAQRGPALVVLTRGGDGAHGVTAGGVEAVVDAHPVDIIDTVGAGDAFTAGLVDSLRLAGLLGGRSRTALASMDASRLRDVLDRAVLVAAITCGRRGADPPTAAEIDAHA